MIPDVGYSVLIWKKKINGLKQPIFHLSLFFCPIQLTVTETEENLEFKMNLILLSNKWIDQKVRQGLAKIENKKGFKRGLISRREGLRKEERGKKIWETDFKLKWQKAAKKLESVKRIENESGEDKNEGVKKKSCQGATFSFFYF